MPKSDFDQKVEYNEKQAAVTLFCENAMSHHAKIAIEMVVGDQIKKGFAHFIGPHSTRLPWRAIAFGSWFGWNKKGIVLPFKYIKKQLRYDHAKTWLVDYELAKMMVNNIDAEAIENQDRDFNILGSRSCVNHSVIRSMLSFIPLLYVITGLLSILYLGTLYLTYRMQLSLTFFKSTYRVLTKAKFGTVIEFYPKNSLLIPKDVVNAFYATHQDDGVTTLNKIANEAGITLWYNNAENKMIEYITGYLRALFDFDFSYHNITFIKNTRIYLQTILKRLLSTTTDNYLANSLAPNLQPCNQKTFLLLRALLLLPQQIYGNSILMLCLFAILLAKAFKYYLTYRVPDNCATWAFEKLSLVGIQQSDIPAFGGIISTPRQIISPKYRVFRDVAIVILFIAIILPYAVNSLLPWLVNHLDLFIEPINCSLTSKLSTAANALGSFIDPYLNSMAINLGFGHTVE